MFKLLTVLTGLTFLASAGWADDFDKSSSITVEKDASTGIWTVECALTIQGLDGQGAYTVRVLHRLAPGTHILRDLMLSPNDKIFNESSPGVYEIQARLTGKKLFLHAVYFHSPIFANQNPRCDVEVYTGFFGDLIYDIDMQHHIAGDEPSPP